MKWTWASLFYLVAYLFPSGFTLLVFPKFAMDTLHSNTDYGDVMPRLAGMFLFGLGIIILQLIRWRAETLYFTTIIVRTFFCACLVWFLCVTKNPMFITMLVIVGIGLLLTSTCYAIDRSAGRKPGAPAA
jgi:hypothetical protein